MAPSRRSNEPLTDDWEAYGAGGTLGRSLVCRSPVAAAAAP